MKSKKLPLVILLVILILPPIFAQEKKDYKALVQTEFGIDLKKSYSAEQLIDALAICLEEKDIAIDTAYNEGYKIGTLEYLPQLEAEKKKNSLLQQNYDILKTSYEYTTSEKMILGINCFSGGLLVGGIIGGFCGAKISSSINH